MRKLLNKMPLSATQATALGTLVLAVCAVVTVFLDAMLGMRDSRTASQESMERSASTALNDAVVADAPRESKDAQTAAAPVAPQNSTLAEKRVSDGNYAGGSVSSPAERSASEPLQDVVPEKGVDNSFQDFSLPPQGGICDAEALYVRYTGLEMDALNAEFTELPGCETASEEPVTSPLEFPIRPVAQ